MNTPATPPPIPPSPFTFEPMAEKPALGSTLQTLLKHPGRVLHELHHGSSGALATWLMVLSLVGLTIYGVVIGTLVGGSQLWIAPAKLVLGTLFAVVICLPSLYIFICLGGTDVRFRTVCGVLLAAVCLSSTLLVGFAPVAWIFAQSTDSVPLMGALHLLFWLIGLGFGLRLLFVLSRHLGTVTSGHLLIWSLIFVLVCLQMTTTLRPIVGRSDRLLPEEKKFFLTHWADSLSGREATETKPR